MGFFGVARNSYVTWSHYCYTVTHRADPQGSLEFGACETTKIKLRWGLEKINLAFSGLPGGG